MFKYDSDPERTKQIVEWIKWCSLRCRECNKERINHKEYDRYVHGNFCAEFVPPDNLDYVEWLAKKKGLIS